MPLKVPGQLCQNDPPSLDKHLEKAFFNESGLHSYEVCVCTEAPELLLRA